LYKVDNPGVYTNTGSLVLSILKDVGSAHPQAIIFPQP